MLSGDKSRWIIFCSLQNRLEHASYCLFLECRLMFFKLLFGLMLTILFGTLHLALLFRNRTGPSFQSAYHSAEYYARGWKLGLARYKPMSMCSLGNLVNLTAGSQIPKYIWNLGSKAVQCLTIGGYITYLGKIYPDESILAAKRNQAL